MRYSHFVKQFPAIWSGNSAGSTAWRWQKNKQAVHRIARIKKSPALHQCQGLQVAIIQRTAAVQ